MTTAEPIVLLRDPKGVPFVTKVGEDYYVQCIKYTDDVKILLDAIKNVGKTEYQDLFTPVKTKKEYWQKHFNYQYHGGTLILWTNPTEMWDQEQTRRGGKRCPKCKCKMEMHYTPYCPLCDPITEEPDSDNQEFATGVQKFLNGKDIKVDKSRTIYNFSKMVARVEAKNPGLNHRDYGAYKRTASSRYEFNSAHQKKWCSEHFPKYKEMIQNPVPQYGFNQAGLDYCKTKEGERFLRQVELAYHKAPDGRALELPHCDFWHTILPYLEDNNWQGNDSYCDLNWQTLYDKYCKEPWQKEICQLFINEYGKETYYVWISW